MLAFVEKTGGPPKPPGQNLGPGPRKAGLESFSRRVWVGLPRDTHVRTVGSCNLTVSPPVSDGLRTRTPPIAPRSYPSALWPHLPLSPRGRLAHCGDLFSSPRDTVSQLVPLPWFSACEAVPCSLLDKLLFIHKTLCDALALDPSAARTPHHSLSPWIVRTDFLHSVIKYIWVFCSVARPGTEQLPRVKVG